MISIIRIDTSAKPSHYSGPLLGMDYLRLMLDYTHAIALYMPLPAQAFGLREIEIFDMKNMAAKSHLPRFSRCGNSFNFW